MPLSHLEHFLIFAEDPEATRDWYVDVLGMRDGETPDFGFPVYWLYLGERDVVHITQGGAARGGGRRDKYLGNVEDVAGTGSGRIDHVAFHAAGLVDMIARLKEKGVEFIQRQVSDQGVYQLFLRDPNGIKIELNFPNAEAQDIRAPVMATDLMKDGT